MRAVNLIVKQPPRESGTTLRWLFRLFLLAGVLALGYAAYFYVSAYLFQTIESISLDHPSPPNAPPIERIIPEGGVVGRIEIERLGLSAIVVQGDSPSILRRAVGHLRETAMPGEFGNVALAAHRDTFFRPLRNIQIGDVINLETAKGEYQYIVESTTIVPPTAIEVLQSSGKAELTLITCYPFYYAGAAPDRFIVHARKIERQL